MTFVQNAEIFWLDPSLLICLMAKIIKLRSFPADFFLSSSS